LRDDPRRTDLSTDGRETRPDRAGYDQKRDREHETGPRSGGPLPERVKPEDQDRRRPYPLGGRTFRLRESEVRAMTDLGTFRVVAAADLARHAYDGDAARTDRELRHLRHQGLVVERTLPTSRRQSIRIVALTKTGKRLLGGTNRLPDDQAVFHGIVRPREAQHDAALYRLFHAEASRIENAGGRPLRVILDFELKRSLYRERERLGERRNDPLEVAALAERHDLKAVNGKIPLPDLRIEYQTSELELRRLDLELATHHYSSRDIAEKAQAGFALYSPREDAPRLRRILDEQELSAGVFAL